MKKRKKLPNTKSQKRSSKTLQIALLFVIVVGLLIGFSLVVKVGILISKSQFDGQHQFVIQVKEQDKTAAVIFAPETHKIALIKITGHDATASLTKSIELPVDATIQDTSDNHSAADFIHSMLISGLGLNQLDKIKLLIFSQTVASEDITTQHISLPVSPNIDDLITSLATDQSLYKEAKTIAIVNSSDISGVGNTVAKLLTHIGANVISVRTGDNEVEKSSLVYTNDKTYTVNRLSHIFSMNPIASMKPSIADITITIGKDKGAALSSL